MPARRGQSIGWQTADEVLDDVQAPERGPARAALRTGYDADENLYSEHIILTEVTGIDHIYITVSDLARSEPFYDRVLRDALGFRKNTFTLSGDPHIQYFNRLFGFVLRPARAQRVHEPYAPGLHHFCLRVDTVEDVHAVARELQAAGIAATDARLYPEYSDDYCATFFADPDGVRLEVTNWRLERRQRAAHWDDAPA